MVIGQCAKRGLDVSPLGGEFRRFGGRWCERCGQVLLVVRAVALVAADEIDGASVNEGQDPVPGRSSAAVEFLRTPPDREERLLNGVLGEFTLAKNAPQTRARLPRCT